MWSNENENNNNNNTNQQHKSKRMSTSVALSDVVQSELQRNQERLGDYFDLRDIV
jgi:hypothetical protein